MNWGAIGAIGEVAGAIAVVVSLVYLAVQIRENTRSSRSATRQSIVESVIATNLVWSESASFCDVFQQHIDGKEVPAEQYLRLSGYCYVCLRNWESVHFQYRSGMLQDDEWRGFRQNIKQLMQVRAFQEFWEREREVFSDAFRSEVDVLVRETAVSPVAAASVIVPKSSTGSPLSEA